MLLLIPSQYGVIWPLFLETETCPTPPPCHFVPRRSQSLSQRFRLLYGVFQKLGALCGSPDNKDRSVLGSILHETPFSETPISEGSGTKTHYVFGPCTQKHHRDGVAAEGECGARGDVRECWSWGFSGRLQQHDSAGFPTQPPLVESFSWNEQETIQFSDSEGIPDASRQCSAGSCRNNFDTQVRSRHLRCAYESSRKSHPESASWSQLRPLQAKLLSCAVTCCHAPKP